MTLGWRKFQEEEETLDLSLASPENSDLPIPSASDLEPTFHVLFFSFFLHSKSCHSLTGIDCTERGGPTPRLSSLPEKSQSAGRLL